MGSERGVVDFERRPSNEQRRVENGGAEDDEDGAGDDADKTEAKAPEKRNIFFIQSMLLPFAFGRGHGVDSPRGRLAFSVSR